MNVPPPTGVDPQKWAQLVDFAERLKADHFAGHPRGMNNDMRTCDWCAAAEVTEVIYCGLRHSEVPVADCVASCGAPEQRVVCMTTQRTKEVGGGTYRNYAGDLCCAFCGYILPQHGENCDRPTEPPGAYVEEYGK